MKPTFQKFILASICVVFFICLAVYRIRSWDCGSGDTAFLTQITDNIATRGKAVSQLSASFSEMFARVFTTPTDELCSSPLKIQSEVELHLFTWHAYLILYVIAPFVWIFGGKATLSVLTALSFAAIPIGAYYYLWHKGRGHLSCLLVSLLLISHPAWGVSIQGQLYADRLFLGIGFIVFLLLDSPEKNRAWILTLMVLGSTISERFGLILGPCTVIYLALQRAPIRPNLAVYGTAAFVTAASVFLLKFAIIHPSNSSFASSMTPGLFLSNYQTYPGFKEKLWCFALINGAFILMAVKNWRLACIAIFAALPNILGNIGGAEKTGFLSHYHSTYLPILAAAVVTSAGNARPGWMMDALRGAHLFVFLMIGTATFSLSIGNVAESAPVSLWKDARSLFAGPKAAALSQYREIGAEIRPGANIVTLEALMPSIYRSAKNVQMYPLGLDDAEYIILPWWQSTPGGPYEFPASYSFLGAEERKKQDILIGARMRRLGFDLDHPKLIGPWAILTKRK